MPPVIAKENAPNIWQLYGLSTVWGMGSGEWLTPLLTYDCSEVVALNRMDGEPSYVAFHKESKWGLLEIVDDQTLECAVRVVELPNKFDDLDALLSQRKISKCDYIIGLIHDGDQDCSLYG
jgi:hypothetical protein